MSRICVIATLEFPFDWVGRRMKMGHLIILILKQLRVSLNENVDCRVRMLRIELHNSDYKYIIKLWG